MNIYNTICFNMLNKVYCASILCGTRTLGVRVPPVENLAYPLATAGVPPVVAKGYARTMCYRL